jgi:hypothetical protein
MSNYDEHGNWHPPRDKSPTLSAQQSPTIPAEILEKIPLWRGGGIRGGGPQVMSQTESALTAQVARLTAERDAIAAGAAASQQQGLAVIERLHNENAALRAQRSTGWVSPKNRYVPPVLFNPYTGEPRDARDIASDPQGKLIVPPGADWLAAAAPKEG